MPWVRSFCLAALTAALGTSTALAQREFGFVNTRPSGQPYLSPEESVRRFKLPPEWEVTVFAAEPDIINPIAFTVDERGRLWVVECYEYPKRTPPGKQPRDRIKILEDTTGSGKADKVTLWAEGKDLPRFDLASGIEVGYGGVFLGASPYLFFLKDSKGTGRCDSHEILLSGFGSQDTHEVLNTFQWGPDGRLYGLHGIFTQSKVGDVQMNAAVWRYDYPKRKFDIFAEGTSNPWGLDFDEHGQAILACCVIPHAFHMIPGGTYIRQAGGSQNPYAYGLLREICDHTHHAESGWAHAGVVVLQGDDVPASYHNSFLMGSIHGCSIKRDTLERRGSTFVAHHGPDLLQSGDKNFRPVNMRWGPDGSIYVIDWHDQNPCHQALPDSWDMTHGRIYKIRWKGARNRPAVDLGKKSSAELVEYLKDSGPWCHRTALRLLRERQDPSVIPALKRLAFEGDDVAVRLRGLWALYAMNTFDEATAEQALQSDNGWIRSWAVRLLGESNHVSPAMLQRATELATADRSPEVRLQLASTARRLAGQDVFPLLQNLMQLDEDARDPCIPLMIWLALEPRVAAEPDRVLDWLGKHAVDNALVRDEIVGRALRRLGATGKPQDLSRGLRFLASVHNSAVRRRALEGLLQSVQDQASMPAAWREASVALLKDPDVEVGRLARRLAVKFRDVVAVRRALAVVRDGKRSVAERVDAVRDLASAHPPEALAPLEDVLARDPAPELRSEVLRALAAYDRPEVGRKVLVHWKEYDPALRTEAVNMLAGRKEWARDLLTAVGRNEIARTDLNNNVILRIRALRDPGLNQQVEKVWGRVRESTPAELATLIDRMRVSLGEGRASFERGRKVFENQCSKCHRFEGRGHDVGPSLDGAGRDIEYLLVNVLDPNRVVGQPYYAHYVTLKNGRVETGLKAAEDERSITLKGENDALRTIPRKDVEEILVQEKSLMPEGLANNMTPQDFRDLILYVMANPFLTDVSVAGPFPADAPPAVDLADPAKSPGVQWTRPVVGAPGRIPLPQALDAEKVALVYADVTAPEALRTRLELGAVHPLDVWLSGRLVYKGTPARGLINPDQAGVDVDLRPGVNHIVFRVRYRGGSEAIYARFLDPLRKLTYPEDTNPKR